MTSFAPAPAAPIRRETPARCAATRGRAAMTACGDGRASAARDAPDRVGLLRSPVAALRLWWRRVQESHELREMSDGELRDIGISSSEAWHAARRPFWRD